MSSIVRKLVEAAEAFDVACDSADPREFFAARARLRAVLPKITTEDDPDAPEPSLRDALAAALHEARRAEYPGARGPLAVEWRYLTDAERDGERRIIDRIIAALPGLSLSAQPSEPGETGP